jgi:mediator of RNA polymerase II transcription subunit 14
MRFIFLSVNFDYFTEIIQHHSRVLPSRSWAGAVPTLLTHEALDTLCSQGSHPQKEIPGPDLSPLERFLGCVFMRKQLQKLIQTEDYVIY